MKILLSLLLPFALFNLLANSKLYLFAGQTGAGKSALINFLAQKEIAAEGSSFSLQTLNAKTYAIEFNGAKNHYIDVPGILDTSGFTEEEILLLIKAEIFNQRENHGFDHISGIIIVLDASMTRIRVRDNIVAVVSMFGESCLDSIVLAINKIENLSFDQRQAAFDYVTSEANAVGIAANQIVAIDSKGTFSTYYPALEEKLRDLPGYDLEGMNELDQRAEAYFIQELNKSENYNESIQIVPRIIEREIPEQILTDEPDMMSCECRNVCIEYFLWVFCVKEEEFCGNCAYTRQVPRWMIRIIRETVYDEHHQIKLRNDNQYYRELGKERVAQEIRKFIFSNKQRRKVDLDL